MSLLLEEHGSCLRRLPSELRGRGTGGLAVETALMLAMLKNKNPDFFLISFYFYEVRYHGGWKFWLAW